LLPSGGKSFAADVSSVLFSQPDFRRAYLANAVSQLGNAFQFVALMWFAVVAAGPFGIIVVRLVDALPALLFGLHGGIAADRWDRRRVTADFVRGLVLVPVAVVAVVGTLPLWALVASAFVLTTAASYFTPALGAFLPSLVGRSNVQRANGLVSAASTGLNVTGWAVAAAMLEIVSVGTFDPTVMFLTGGIVLFALALTAAAFVRASAAVPNSPRAAVSST
jgi:hypothetical protein